MKTGIELIAEERQRQISDEGWTPEHDDQHINGELAVAGACYALAGQPLVTRGEDRAAKKHWPWDREWWKPSDPIKNLVRAGALIAAEIDRLQREGIRAKAAALNTQAET